MLQSIASLLLLVIPGYSLVHVKWIRQKIDVGETEKFVFGFIIWVFYLVATILIAKIMIPQYIRYVHWFNYFLGFILAGYWLLVIAVKKLPKRPTGKLRINLTRSTLGGTLPFLVPMISFVVLITLYTPIIFQYDALGMYLIQGGQLAESSTSLDISWPTFGDSMPVMPILYSWFYQLTDTPILRVIPILFFFLSIFLVYRMARGLSPRKPHAAYTSLVSLVSIISLYWYMAKTSLYLDLSFIFFAACSVYMLMHVLGNKSTRFGYVVLGMSLALLILSKEYGILHTWFIIGILLFSHYRVIIRNTFQAFLQGLFLLAPFLIRHLSYIAIYSFLETPIMGPIASYQSFLICVFLLLLTLILPRVHLEGPTRNLSTLILILVPLSFPTVFFTHNFLTLGVPFGTLSEPYLQRLHELGITFAQWRPTDFSILKLPDILFTNTLMAMNIVPFLSFFSALLLPSFKRSRSMPTRLLLSWFFYSLFTFYFVSFGQFEGGFVRRLLPLIIPVTLMVGKGVHYLLEYHSLPGFLGTAVYTFAASIFLAHLWFVKLDGSEWWLKNLQLVVKSYPKASYVEVLLYASPWLLLILFVIANKSLSQAHHFGCSEMHPGRIFFLVSVTLTLFSSATAFAFFSQAVGNLKTPDPAYYDQADSVKPYINHWFIPVLDFYRSQLSNDNSTTIGFGVTPLQYFLRRPFIDLTYPRNWLIHLPLISSTSTDEIVGYLRRLDACYFLIPTEVYGTRDKYEAALKNSTLFRLIETSAVFAGNGQIFSFEKLATFRPFELYTIKRL